MTASTTDHKLSKQLKTCFVFDANNRKLIEFFLVDSSTHQQHHQVIRNKTIFFTTKRNAIKFSVNAEVSIDFWASKIAQEMGCTWNFSLLLFKKVSS